MKYEKCKSCKLKIGFAAGLSFSKKSSERNKAKRWMREAIKPFLGKITVGHQIIFLINHKFPSEQMSFPLIKEKAEDLLLRANLIK